MYKLSFIFFIFLSIYGCKSDSSKENSSAELVKQAPSNASLSAHPALIKVAQAHGLEAWNKTKQIEFQFNVKHDESEMHRKWLWDLENEQITRFIENDEITTSTDAKTANPEIHQAFINDTYWLVFPFHLLHTEAYNVVVNKSSKCPINENKVTEIAIQFSETGGYTPGDLYKIYLDENQLIQSWSFHSSGKETPDLVNSWENYQNFDGLQLSLNRPNNTGDFEIYFNHINVHQ